MKDERRELSIQKAHDHGNPIRVVLKITATSAAGQGVINGIERAKKSPLLGDIIQGWLYRTPIQGSRPGTPDDEAVVETFLNNYLTTMKLWAVRTLLLLKEWLLKLENPDQYGFLFEDPGK